MKSLKFVSLIFMVGIIGLSACSDDDDKRSGENKILKFTIVGVNATIDYPNGTIKAEVPASSAVELYHTSPYIEISDKAKIDPAGDEDQNFNKPVVYTVTAENGGSKDYTVTVTVKQ